MRTDLLVFGYCRCIKNADIPSEVIELCQAFSKYMSKGEIYTLENNMQFFECSAKNGTNVNEAFNAIAIKGYEQEKEFEESSTDSD